MISDIISSMFGDNDSKKEPSDQSPDEINLAGWIRSKAEESRQSPTRLAFESEALTNTAYLLGYDSMYFDARFRVFRSVGGWGPGATGSPSRNRSRINLIMPTIQNRCARLCKNPPKYDVRPNSMDQDDKDAARLSLKALNNKFAEEKVNEKRINLTMWMQQAGYAYVKVGWDAMKGKAIPKLDGTGVEYQGDICIEVISPFEVFVDREAKTLEESPWLIHAKVRKLSYFIDHYGEKGKMVRAESAWLMSLQNLQKIQSMTPKGSGDSSADYMKNAAIEIAYYERPTKKYPGGRLIVVANGVILEYKELPIDEIPFAKFDDVKIGGKFNSESIITQMRPIQDQLNRNSRKKAEFIAKGMNLKILAAKGHGLHEEAMNDTTEVVEYNPVDKAERPTAINPPSVPQYLFTDDERYTTYLGQVAGISEVSSGQMPSASIPALGMQILQEADETRIGIVTESNENAWADIGRYVLKYMNKYYDDERYIKESGANSEYTITRYNRNDLKNATDVIVIKNSTLPDSKTLKRQDLLNTYNMGLLGDPADASLRRRVLQQLEFGDIAGVWEDQMIDDRQIERDIELMEQGGIPVVDPDDNHVAHFEAKNRLRKSDKFLTYDPMIQKIVLNNIAQHKMFLQPPMPMVPGGGPTPGSDPGVMGGPPMPPGPEEQIPLEEGAPPPEGILQ